MLRINVKDGRLKSCGLAKVEDVHRACAEFLNVLHIEKRMGDNWIDGV